MKTQGNKFFDKDFRQKLIDNPKAALAESSIESSKNVEIIVHKATKNTIYFVIPSKNTLNLDTLKDVNAAGCAGSVGTVGSVGSASSLGTVTTTSSSISTVASFGSVGSAGSA